MSHESNDIKQIGALVLCFITNDFELVDNASLKMIMSCLVYGVREKNPIVKTNSELAMVSTLRLKQKDEKAIKVSCTSL